MPKDNIRFQSRSKITKQNKMLHNSKGEVEINYEYERKKGITNYLTSGI